VIFLNYSFSEKKIKDIILNSSQVISDVVDFLYENFKHYSWIGIYIVKGNYLVLGPWRGKQATEHKKIPIGKGICGSAATSGKTEIISDVNYDKRYLACFVTTKSEIVVPIKKDGEILGEIDIDSDYKNSFSKEDKLFLEKIADMLSKHI
jgi:putative methionine-R-sulfoxide reductase with GAF domain